MSKYIPWKLLFNNALKIKSFKMPSCVLLSVTQDLKKENQNLKWEVKSRYPTWEAITVLSHGSWTRKEIRALSTGCVQVTTVKPSSPAGPGLRSERGEAQRSLRAVTRAAGRSGRCPRAGAVPVRGRRGPAPVGVRARWPRAAGAGPGPGAAPGGTRPASPPAGGGSCPCD